MFKSFFKKSKAADSNTKSNVGLIKTNPILLTGIPSSYGYLNSLCKINPSLSYERIGSLEVDGFPNPMDKYKFIFEGSDFCEVFIYPYNAENHLVIPIPFLELDPKADRNIFSTQEEEEKETTSNKMEFIDYLYEIVGLVLIKNGAYSDPDVKWNEGKKQTLDYYLEQTTYEDELEKLIMDELKDARKEIESISKKEFILNFLANFHDKKLNKYAPDFILERNKKIIKAFDNTIETIRRIQGWLDNELLRKRIEIRTLEDINNNKLGIFVINQCVTPFFILEMISDVFGRFKLVYSVDARILDMLPGDMASTLLRRIYEFTSGELESFVQFKSLNMNCISIFENLKEDETVTVINVERHKEKSMSDLLNGIISDDIDDETKKWLKR